MLKVAIYLLLFFFPFGYSSNIEPVTPALKVPENYQLYEELDLKGKVTFEAFDQAMAGHKQINRQKKDIITLIDFTKPSTTERLFVIDLKHRKILLSSVVSHGKNSGGNYATSFSNKNGSNQSSLGFYITENTYRGKNGYSLVLNGLEKGINDQAKARAIVIHGAKYANPSVINSSGRLGRSLGCPALPESINAAVIDAIKDGSLLYIYANNKNYLAQTQILPSHTI